MAGRKSKNRITIEQLEEFDIIIGISGSRVYNDYDFFSSTLHSFVELPEFDGKTICFVTGEASQGPDDMIITWCDENEMPFYGEPAQWDLHGKRAGFMRNVTMSDLITHLLAFWAAKSKGTKHMIDICEKKYIKVTPLIVDPDHIRLGTTPI